MYTSPSEPAFVATNCGALNRASFDLKANPPTVQVKAANSKRRKRELLPLPNDMAQMMRAVSCRPAAARKGLARPLVAKVCRNASARPARGRHRAEEPRGRVVDFHGQRTTFITGLARAGVTPATAQRLARHSDINLTLGTYTRLGMEDLAAAVEQPSRAALGSPSAAAESGGARSARAAAVSGCRPKPARRILAPPLRPHPKGHYGNSRRRKNADLHEKPRDHPAVHVLQYVLIPVVACRRLSPLGTEGLFGTPDCQKQNPLRGKGFGTRLALIVKAEGKGFEPSTGYPAPDFESGC